MLLLVSLALADVSPDALSGYDRLRAALVVDDDAGAVTAATALGALAGVDSVIADASRAVAGAQGIAARRQAFGELSKVVIAQLSTQTNPPKSFAYHCPMATGFQYWVQASMGIQNPYMGQSMPACGSEVSLKKAAKAAAP
ncbi:MAG: DUF3347 domain-containing protein [Deltaproteobacteria bacterium]|nr:DUF3347 domain-containing protein [Deltaproteobacteria bacterium]